MNRPKPWQFGICFVACALLFEHPIIPLVVGLAAWLLFQLIFKRNRKVLVLMISTALSIACFEWIGRLIIRHNASRFYNTDVDHRFKPDAARGINKDGIRSPVEADDYTDDTFNILLLGDSFVYGVHLDHADTIPVQLEKHFAGRYPDKKIRVVNFAWPSSSPGPCYRLLKNVGAKYKPDLVVECLDVTDFRDDLRALSDVGYWDYSPIVYILRRLGLGGELIQLHDAWRPRIWFRRSERLSQPAPAYWQFVVRQPFAASLTFMKETERNLNLINDYCRNVLKVPFAVVLFPRNFQYSDKECPYDPARDTYDVLGPYVREPERWLESLKPRVDFPCESLLSWFEASPVFPKCFDDDPHWTAAGCGVAAEGIARFLNHQSLLGRQPEATAVPGSP